MSQPTGRTTDGPDDQPDEVMRRIGRGITLGQQGDRSGAREVFRHLWDDEEAGLDAFHRCALAHSMADVQDDADEELVWDLRALAAADSVTEEQVRQEGVSGSVLGFYPSLYLNLGDVSRRLGDPTSARRYAKLGTDAMEALSDDGYGRMIRQGLARLLDRLDETPSELELLDDDTGGLEVTP